MKEQYLYNDQTGVLTETQTFVWNENENDWELTGKVVNDYSNQFATDKTPRNFRAQESEGAYLLEWDQPVMEGLTGYKLYNGYESVAELDADARSMVYQITVKGLNPVYLAAVYGEHEVNISEILELDKIVGEEKEYPMPTFGDITNVEEKDYQVYYEMYWHAPETDMNVASYTVHFNEWPLEEEIQGTTYSCTLRRMLDDITFGVSAVYEDGGESEVDNRNYNLSELLTSIKNASKGNDIWSYQSNICIEASSIRSVEIYTVSGTKVVERVLSNGINLIKLPADVYIIKALTDNGTITKKVVNK